MLQGLLSSAERMTLNFVELLERNTSRVCEVWRLKGGNSIELHSEFFVCDFGLEFHLENRQISSIPGYFIIRVRGKF